MAVSLSPQPGRSAELPAAVTCVSCSASSKAAKALSKEPHFAWWPLKLKVIIDYIRNN
jgi:hypothetical protein